MERWIRVLAFASLTACGSAGGAPTPVDAQSNACPDPADRAWLSARRELDRLNDACRASGDQCASLERPGATSEAPPIADNLRRRIDETRAVLAQHGMTVRWSLPFLRYVTEAEEAVWLVVGGNFTPDHLGPDAHDAVLRRVRDAPRAHLAEVEHLADRMSPEALSSLYVPNVLAIVRAHAPREVACAAGRLRLVHQRALAAPERDPYQHLRLRDRIADLERLARAEAP